MKNSYVPSDIGYILEGGGSKGPRRLSGGGEIAAPAFGA